MASIFGRFGAVIGAVLAFAALGAAPVRAQSVAWDQDRVTELATELADTLHQLQRDFRREPPPSAVSGEARARHRFRDTLRVLRHEARALASELEAGAGREETLPIARRSRSLVRDLREDGRRMSWREPVVGQAGRAEQILSQLGPFYFDAEDASGSDAPER